MNTNLLNIGHDEIILTRRLLNDCDEMLQSELQF